MSANPEAFRPIMPAAESRLGKLPVLWQALEARQTRKASEGDVQMADLNELNSTAVGNIARMIADEIQLGMNRNTAAILAVGIEIIKSMSGHAAATNQSIEQRVLDTFNNEFEKIKNPVTEGES